MSLTRLNAVSYLNTKHLVYALEEHLLVHNFQLIYDVPSICAQQIKKGNADAGVIPSIEYARSDAPYAIVPDIAIASNGPVNSIFLFHTVPVEHIKTVALDTSSRTSVALTHIILREKYHLRFTPIDHPPVLDRMLSIADAALVIGDPALECTDRPEPHLDLGEEWTDMTGLPFVYAFWAGHHNRLDASDVHILIEAKKIGLTALTDIAAVYARTHRGSSTFYEAYLRDHLQYAFGLEEQKGLKAFYERAYQYDLIDAVPELHFF